MPQLSRFYGIVILMFFNDHAPPHFHARYAGRKGRFALDGTKIDGDLPRRAENLIADWVALHGDELADCWERAVRNEPTGSIEPLP